MQNDAPRKRGRPFTPGNRFGKGRPAGSRNKVTLACEHLLQGEGEAVVRTMIQRAKKGDPTCMRLSVDRIYPIRKESPIDLDLPEIRTAEDLALAYRVGMGAVAEGRITSDQAESLTRSLEFGRKVIETEELARGLAEVRAEVQEMKEYDERRAA